MYVRVLGQWGRGVAGFGIALDMARESGLLQRLLMSMVQGLGHQLRTVGSLMAHTRLVSSPDLAR